MTKKEMQEHAFKELLKKVVDNGQNYTETMKSDLKEMIDCGKSPEEICAGCRKSPPVAAFSAKTHFPCAFGAAGETCKETLLRKASESTAHVAGFGIQLGGLRPSEPPRRFFDSLGKSPEEICEMTLAYFATHRWQ